MKRLIFPYLLLAACSAAPPAPLPPAPSPPAQAEVRAPWIELTDGVPTPAPKPRRTTKVVGRAPDGGKRFEVTLPHPPAAIIPASDGGAFAVLDEPTKHSPGKALATRGLIRLDPKGAQMWRLEVEHGSDRFLLLEAPDRLLAFDLGWKHLYVVDATTGALVRHTQLAKELSGAAARAGVLVLAEPGSVTRVGLDGEKVWSVRIRPFPGVEPFDPPAGRAVAVGEDGTVLTGSDDGSLLALDPEGKPRFQLGVRGAVTAIEARPGGAFAVSTQAGVVAIVGPGGAVRDPSTTRPVPTGVVDLRAPPKGTAPAKTVPATPTAAYRAAPVEIQGKPFKGVLSVVTGPAPDEVWVLGHLQGPNDDERLFHHDSHGWTDLGAQAIELPKAVFAEGHPASRSLFLPQRLARGPGGSLLMLGMRSGDGQTRIGVFERAAKGFKERRDLGAALAKLEASHQGGPSYAFGPGGREVVCNGEPVGCVEQVPGAPGRVLPKDQGRTMPGVSPTGRLRFAAWGVFGPVLFAGPTLWRVNGHASGEDDVWGAEGASLVHWNGSTFETREAPLPRIDAVWASGRDDLWVSGHGGVARFDGRRWWDILATHFHSSEHTFVTGSRAGDVWVHGPNLGLWHVTLDPSAQPDLEGKAEPPPPAAPPSRPLAVSGPDPSFRLERVELKTGSGKPLQSAISVAQAPGGVLWFHDGARLVEHDGGAHTRALYQAPPAEPFYCWSAPEPDCSVCADCTPRRPLPLDGLRIAAPTGPGRGVALAERDWLRIGAGRWIADPPPLPNLVAVAAGPTGAVWAVSAREDDLPRALILGPEGHRLLTGLPPAAYADLAVRADDDAWFAGGLTTSTSFRERHVLPSGEGTLVRFDGRTFTRHRGPDGALLAVAATSPGEAWAVGVGGGLVHVQSGKAEAMHLEGTPVLLRAVAGGGAGEVWMAGDGGTLLRWDGKALWKVDVGAGAKGAGFAALVAPGETPGWVVGPAGIWKIVRR